MSEAAQPKARILDVYGAFGRELGGWISIASLISLLAELDIDPQAVRSAASRMKRAGLLESRKIDGVAGYELSGRATEILEDGDTRVYRNPGEVADRGWIIALFSVPEAERQNRYAIRSRLAKMGFGPGPAASWFAPAAVLSETKRMIERNDLAGYVSLWSAEYLGFDDLEEIVARAWDLAAIEARYREFIELAEAVSDRSGLRNELDDRAAFIDYLTMLSRWRPLPYLDPGLPGTVTPPDWPAGEAHRLWAEHQQRLRPAAMRHFVSVAG